MWMATPTPPHEHSPLISRAAQMKPGFGTLTIQRSGVVRGRARRVFAGRRPVILDRLPLAPGLAGGAADEPAAGHVARGAAGA